MSTTEVQTVAAGHSVAVGPACWQAGLEELLGRVAGRFGRVEPCWRARALVLGLLADLPRKNCWTLAEHAGNPTPDGMQHLLGRAVWDEDGVRDDVRAYMGEHLGDPGAVLVVDETGDLKKGTATVGVQRQYTGTAGRVENAQVAVLLVYASPAGHAVIDRELYLPRSWTRDPERLRAAGVPAQVGFATKPALATAMITRALDAGVPASWVAGDEVYGADPKLRACLESRGIGYVLAVACDHPVGAGGGTWRADALLRRVPARAWQCISAGQGAKGHRYDDWAFVQLDPGARDPGHPGQRWLLVRRNRKTGELAFYRCWMPRPTPLAVLVRVAGRHWTVEERIQTSKGLCGLDQHQVRRWRSWYRWMTLAMLAHAFLVVAALTNNTRHPPPPGLIGLTCTSCSTCSPRCSPVPPMTPPTGCAGRCGDADSRPAPAPCLLPLPPAPTDHEDQRAACRPGAGSVATCQNRIVTLDKSGELWHGAAASQQRWSSLQHATTQIHDLRLGVLEFSAWPQRAGRVSGSARRRAPGSHD